MTPPEPAIVTLFLSPDPAIRQMTMAAAGQTPQARRSRLFRRAAGC
jgi:hypothetical protein